MSAGRGIPGTGIGCAVLERGGGVAESRRPVAESGKGKEVEGERELTSGMSAGFMALIP
jgi:hypothetical protein